MGRSIAELADAFFQLGAGTLSELKDAVDGRVPSAVTAAVVVDADVDVDDGRAGPGPGPWPGPWPYPPPAVLVFDTETDGGKGGQLAVQIAWCVYDAAGYELSSRSDYLALPPGRTINGFAQRVHGITMQMLKDRGLAPQFVLADFFDAVDRVTAAGGRIVAHNAQFDAAVVSHTATSCGLARDLRAAECFCTMEHSKRRLGLVNKRGGLKAPKNVELHEHLLGPVRDELQLHDALADVRITAASYFAGGERGWW